MLMTGAVPGPTLVNTRGALAERPRKLVTVTIRVYVPSASWSTVEAGKLRILLAWTVGLLLTSLMIEASTGLLPAARS